jgi:hypothetical protein
MAIIKKIWGMNVDSPLTVEHISQEDMPNVNINNNVFSIIPSTPDSINVNVNSGEICNAICQFTALSDDTLPVFTYNNTGVFNINSTSVSTITNNKTYQIVFLNNCCTINEFNIVNTNIIISDGTNEGKLTIDNDNIII